MQNSSKAVDKNMKISIKKEGRKRARKEEERKVARKHARKQATKVARNQGKLTYGRLEESRQYCTQKLAGTRQETKQEQSPKTRQK